MSRGLGTRRENDVGRERQRLPLQVVAAYLPQHTQNTLVQRFKLGQHLVLAGFQFVAGRRTTRRRCVLRVARRHRPEEKRGFQHGGAGLDPFEVPP